MKRRSSVVEAHEIYLKYHRHHQEDEKKVEGKKDDAPKDLGGRDHKVRTITLKQWFSFSLQTILTLPLQPVPTFPMFHRVMKTGVIYATSRAQSKGFSNETEGEWAK
jgi:hypothetical protein